MKLNRKLVMVAALVLSVAMATTGTLAYLSDSDADVNVMTLGNVKIEQHEYERALTADGEYETTTIGDNTSYVLQTFSQGKPMLPVIVNPGSGVAGSGWDTTRVNMTQVDSYGSMQVFQTPNAVDKFVTVENTGKSDAYVRTLVAVEIGDGSAALLGISHRGTEEENDFSDPWKLKKAIATIERNGTKYVVHEFVYHGAQLSNGEMRHENGVLPAGDTTYPSLCQVYLRAEATNEDCEALDGNDNGVLDVIVLSQAVQAAGFENAQAALDAAFGKTSEKVAEWFNGVAAIEYVTSADKLPDAVKNGGTVVMPSTSAEMVLETEGDLTFDGNNTTVVVNGDRSEPYTTGLHAYLGFVPPQGKSATVSNLKVGGAGFVEVGHYGMGGGQYTLNNVKIENLASTLANEDKGFVLGCGFAHYGNATLNNCVMTGTTAVNDGVMPVDAGFVNGTTTVVNGGKYGTVYCWSHAVVTIDDAAEIDTLYVSPIKGNVTIKTGTHVGTINVDYGTSTPNIVKDRLSKLIIEDGAIVDEIVHQGKTYTVDTWKTYVENFPN